MFLTKCMDLHCESTFVYAIFPFKIEFRPRGFAFRDNYMLFHSNFKAKPFRQYIFDSMEHNPNQVDSENQKYGKPKI